MGETEPYRPSNGTEGECFQEQFCYRCEKDRYASRPCRILGRTMAFDIKDAEYPREWIKDAGIWPGNPRCTAFEERKTLARPNIIRDKRQEGLPL